jgi:hypothetical protein
MKKWALKKNKAQKNEKMSAKKNKLKKGWQININMI